MRRTDQIRETVRHTLEESVLSSFGAGFQDPKRVGEHLGKLRWKKITTGTTPTSPITSPVAARIGAGVRTIGGGLVKELGKKTLEKMLSARSFGVGEGPGVALGKDTL